MATDRSTEGMPVYPKAAPTIEGGEGGGATRFVSGSERCLPRSCKLLMHFRKEWHQRGALRTSATPTEKPLVQPRRIGTWWRIPHEPDILGGLGKHSRHLWVWLGQRYHILSSEGAPKETRGAPPSSRGPSTLLRQLHRLQSAWGVSSSTWGSPHRDPQITSDSTGCSATPGAGMNAGSRQRDSAMFDIAESITQLRDTHVHTRRTWTIHESFLSADYLF